MRLSFSLCLLLIFRYPYESHSIRRHGVPLRDGDFVDERVVFIHARTGKRVQQALLGVVDVASTVIGGIKVQLDLYGTCESTMIRPSGNGRHLLPILTAIAADEDAWTDMPVIVVERWRPG